MHKLLSALVTMLVLASPASAQKEVASQEPPPPPGLEKSQARLVSEYTSVRPGGTTTVALVIDMEKGWHTYWDGQNDAGIPTTIEFDLPHGWEASEILWPAPRRYESAGGIIDYVYFDQAVHLVSITAPVDAREGDIAKIKAEAEWLVCEDVCLPAWQEVELELVVSNGMPEPTRDTQLIRDAQSELPEMWRYGSPVVALNPKFDGLGISTTLEDVELEFYPLPDCAQIRDIQTNGKSPARSLKLPLADPTKRSVIRGVLRVMNKPSDLNSPSDRTRDLTYQIEFTWRPKR